MKIGIIGTGNMARVLGRGWLARGHEVRFGSRTPARRRDEQAHGGGLPQAPIVTNQEAASFGEVVVLAVPGRAAVELAASLRGLEGKTLIDLTNPLTESLDLFVGWTDSMAERLAAAAPGARVVKAFNTLFSAVIGVGGSPTSAASTVRAPGQPRPACFLCGDDEEAKDTVSRLAAELGFQPVDSGPLTSARLLEPVGVLNIVLGYHMSRGTDIALALLEPQQQQGPAMPPN